MTENNNRPNAPIQATERSFRIIEEIRERDGAGITELADHFGVSKSTIHEHLTTLVQMDYLCRDGNEYKIGLRFLTIGGYARRKQRLYKNVRSEIDDLAAETGESVKAAVEQHGKGVFLYQARGDRAVHTNAHDGTRVYLHSTGVGKAILSELPAERVENIVERWGLQALTENTITDKDELYTELNKIQERGYAIDNEEYVRGVQCIAVPVMGQNGVLGGISVSGPRKRFEQNSTLNELVDLLKNTARITEINIKNG